MKTQFDTEISQAGFNFIKDLFPCNQPLQNFGPLRHNKIRKLQNIVNKIPPYWKNNVMQSNISYITVLPNQMVNLNGADVYLKTLPAGDIYKQLITNKTRLPTGLQHWMEEFEVSDDDIKLAFTFARTCSTSIFDQMFQYKIITNILPTNDYLYRYQVLDSDTCSRCQVKDTIEHNLWRCQPVVPYIAKIVDFLRAECSATEQITLKTYIFGIRNANGLNHVFLELKKDIFYNWNPDVSVATFCERFLLKLRKVIIKEKHIMTARGKFDTFSDKWMKFSHIYDFLGPDPQIIF